MATPNLEDWLPDLHCVVQKGKEGSKGEGAGEHGDEPKLDDDLEILIDDHGCPGGGQEEVLKILDQSESVKWWPIRGIRVLLPGGAGPWVTTFLIL